MSTTQPPIITKSRLEALLDLALEHASHGWNALENGFQYCPTCGWFGEASKPDIQSEKWAVCPTCRSLVFRVSIGKRVDPDMWPPQTEALVGTAPYHLAAMIRYVHNAYQLVLAERTRDETGPIEGIKPVPKPTFSTDLLREQESTLLHRSILEAIATRSPFEYAILDSFYKHYKSYNLLVVAVDYCAKMGYVSLGIPPIYTNLDQTCKCTQCSWAGMVSETKGVVNLACPICTARVEIFE